MHFGEIRSMSSIEIHLKFISQGLIEYKAALVQVLAGLGQAHSITTHVYDMRVKTFTMHD